MSRVQKQAILIILKEGNLVFVTMKLWLFCTLKLLVLNNGFKIIFKGLYSSS